MGRGNRGHSSLAADQPRLWSPTTISDLGQWNPPPKSLIALCAVPGSGKSTVARQLWADREGWRVVCLDTLRGRIPGSTGEADQSMTRPAVALMQTLIKEGLANGERVVVDATNVQTRVRKDLLDLAQDAHRSLICFDYPLTVAKERNRLRERVVPEEVLDRMYQQLQATLVNAQAEPWHERFRLTA